MITRGLIIGKIVDDIAGLKYQIQTRNKLQLYDLSKVCEDFFREILNIVYDLNLTNLNNERVNEPGIDLGDKKSKVAYQITSTKYSQKIKATLKAITDAQKTIYDNFYVLILGERASSYTIDGHLLENLSFNTDHNILDLDDILRDIIVADTEVLDALYSLFHKEFRQVRIELEPVDTDGNFESSLYNQIEQIPIKKPENAVNLKEYINDDDSFNLKEVHDLYYKLSKIPRITRELIPIIVERGIKKGFNYQYEQYGILPQVLKHTLRLTEDELSSELAILTDAEVIYFAESYNDEILCNYVALEDYYINILSDWALENNHSLRKMFNTMDWTILDDK